MSVAYGTTVVCSGGIATGHDEAAVKDHLAGRHVEVSADLGLGVSEASMLTNDLTHAYIDENAKTS